MPVLASTSLQPWFLKPTFTESSTPLGTSFGKVDSAQWYNSTWSARPHFPTKSVITDFPGPLPWPFALSTAASAAWRPLQQVSDTSQDTEDSRAPFWMANFG